MMESTDIERQVAHLVEHIGMERAEVERIMEDEDLWMQDPPFRYAFLDPAEDVRQWEIAYAFAEALHEGFGDSKAANEATQQLLLEMRERAVEALRRARRRAEAALKE